MITEKKTIITETGIDTKCGCRALSIFQRKTIDDMQTDSNQLLNALRSMERWEFGNPKKDLMVLLKNFVSASHLLPKYDTIITTPSDNELNKIAFRYLIRLIPHDNSFENFFVALSVNDIYENLIDDNYIEENFSNPVEAYNEIDDVFSLMNKTNGGIFSYRFLQSSKYREAIIQSMKINMGAHSDLNYADAINNKNVLVFDDTITSGKAISDSGKAITEMFAPESITFIALFPALSGEIST